MPQRVATSVCPDIIRRKYKKLALQVGILECPRGKGKILPKFHFIPPKFHFIPPKFYFSPTWRIKDSHVGM